MSNEVSESRANCKPGDGNSNNIIRLAREGQFERVSELMVKDFPPPLMVVPGLIPAGLVLFAGKPKIGKSWMTLDLALTVANGATAFNGQRCEAGDVLLLALEDTEARLFNRIEKLGTHVMNRSRISFAVSMEPGLIHRRSAIRRWAESVLKPKLIVIDTLSQFGFADDDSKQRNAFRADYDHASSLAKFANDLGCAVILVHHRRKAAGDDPLDTVMGTNGFAAGADMVMVLSGKECAAELHGRGRDIAEFTVSLRFDANACRWRFLGDTGEFEKAKLSDRVLCVMRDFPDGVRAKEIADALDMPQNKIRTTLNRMADSGAIERRGVGLFGMGARS